MTSLLILTDSSILNQHEQSNSPNKEKVSTNSSTHNKRSSIGFSSPNTPKYKVKPVKAMNKIIEPLPTPALQLEDAISQKSLEQNIKCHRPRIGAKSLSPTNMTAEINRNKVCHLTCINDLAELKNVLDSKAGEVEFLRKEIGDLNSQIKFLHGNVDADDSPKTGNNNGKFYEYKSDAVGDYEHILNADSADKYDCRSTGENSPAIDIRHSRQSSSKTESNFKKLLELESLSNNKSRFSSPLQSTNEIHNDLVSDAPSPSESKDYCERSKKKAVTLAVPTVDNRIRNSTQFSPANKSALKIRRMKSDQILVALPLIQVSPTSHMGRRNVTHIDRKVINKCHTPNFTLSESEGDKIYESSRFSLIH